MSRRMMMRTVAVSFAASAAIGFMMQSVAGTDNRRALPTGPIFAFTPTPDRDPTAGEAIMLASADLISEVNELSSFSADSPGARPADQGTDAQIRFASVEPGAPEPMPASGRNNARLVIPSPLPAPVMTDIDLPADLSSRAASTFTPPSEPQESMFHAALGFLGLRGSDSGAARAPESSDATDHCTPKLELAAMPDAVINVNLHAPCDPGARLVLRHAGLAVTVRPDAAGWLDLDLPAFESDGNVSISFPDGRTHQAAVAVPDLDNFDRVAIQWQGNDAFTLHAFEFGADFGTEGHIWLETPGESGQAASGHMMRLGSDLVHWPLLAEIYSFPTGLSPRNGQILLEIEASVTPATCGREMLAETIEMRAGAPVNTHDVALPMPECDSPSGFLVLKNLLPTLTIAAN